MPAKQHINGMKEKKKLKLQVFLNTFAQKTIQNDILLKKEATHA